MIYMDTETCGLHGVPVTIQYGYGLDGEAHILECWNEPVRNSLLLIDEMCQEPDGICAFNLSFDWFMLCKWYTMMQEAIKVYGPQVLDWIPIEHVHEIACIEKQARDGHCLKPKAALDLMMVARRGPYQSTMERSSIKIKRVPILLADQLSAELYHRIPIKDIYFARSAKGSRNWSVLEHKDNDGNIDEQFKDVVLTFRPSGALKHLVADALGIKGAKFEDISLGKEFYPEEFGYAPFAESVAPKGPETKDWLLAWPTLLKYHVKHWKNNQQARKYARNDVIYLQELYKFFDSPPPNDTDSKLTCCVAACRWHGYNVDLDKVKKLRDIRFKDIDLAPRAPSNVLRYITPDLSEDELKSIKGSTNKTVMKELAEWVMTCDCVEYGEMDTDAMFSVDLEEAFANLSNFTPEKIIDPDCPKCKGLGSIKHPVAEKAALVIEARTAFDECRLYNKLLLAERFHASYKVYGTLSGRMSGADGLNATGIKHAPEVRECFPLAWPGTQLVGGDFDSFEVRIAISLYNDEGLMNDVKSGKTIHALFAMCLYPDMTYEQILESHEKDSDYPIDMYNAGKTGIYALLFGGDENTLSNRIGISLEVATNAKETFQKKYPGVKRHQDKIYEMFCSMRQTGGVGSKVEWADPAEFIESGLGFRRYYTLENQICKALYDLAEQPPEHWTKLKQRVQRRYEGKDQTVCGAVRSATFASAFAIQAAAMRSAGNHEIQNISGTITKELQAALWGIQPHGYNPWHVQPMNVHDEVMCPTRPDLVDRTMEVQQEVLEKYKEVVPLIKMDWDKLSSWADK